MPASPAPVDLSANLPVPTVRANAGQYAGAKGILARIIDRARFELREWRTPSNPSFIQEELDHALLNEIQWTPGQRVLDVGCASGQYCTAVQRHGVKVTGVDLSMQALTRARSAGHRVGQASALQLPFADGAFDMVLCHKTLYLLNPPQVAAAELARVVSNGGRIVFSTSNRTSPYMRAQQHARGRKSNARWQSANNWSAEQWIGAFKTLGCRTTAIYSCNLVWPIVYRVCDTWLIPNEWMRRYARTVRRLTRTPLRTARLLGAAQDYVIEVTRG